MAKSQNAAINRLLFAARKKANVPHHTKARVVFEAAAKALGVPCSLTMPKRKGYELLQRWVGAEIAVKPKVRRVKPWQGPNCITSPPDVAAPPHAASDAFLRSYEWRRLRMVVIKERGARCECCGRTPKDGIGINVDHIKPRKHHPELALVKSNLQVLCGDCNHGKGNWDDTDWRPESTTVQ